MSTANAGVRRARTARETVRVALALLLPTLLLIALSAAASATLR